MKTHISLPFSAAALALLVFAGCSAVTNNAVNPEGSSMSSIPSSEGFVHSGSSASASSTTSFSSYSSSLSSSEKGASSSMHSGVSVSSSNSSENAQRFVGAGCKVGGCSSQLCVNETSENVVSTCEYREVYGCYRNARCEKQSSGQCEWTQTDALTTCIANAS